MDLIFVSAMNKQYNPLFKHCKIKDYLDYSQNQFLGQMWNGLI